MSIENDGSATAGAPEDSRAQAANGSADGANEPFSGLQDEGARTWVKAKGYKSVEDVVKAAHSLEGRLGSSLAVPGNDAKAEDWDKFYARLRPEKADKYEFKRPEGLPEDLPYDDGLAAKAKEWSHKHGLLPRQAQGIHDEFAREQAARMQAHLETVTKSVEDTHAALVKEWGPAESDGFKTKLAITDRALKKLGLLDSFKRSGIIAPDGALTDPALARAFAAIGEQMFAEDKLDGDSSPGGPNPFKNETFNLSEVTRLSKSDPERARTLAKQAGKNPDEWVGRTR